MVALLSLCTRRLFSSLLLRFDLGFHRLYQFCELFLAFLSCLCVHVFGYAFAVDSWCEPPLVEVVVYHGDASRTGLTDLALVWLKFRLCGGFRCRLFTCLGWLHALREFGHLRICTADFAVDTNCRLLLHSVGDMAVLMPLDGFKERFQLTVAEYLFFGIVALGNGRSIRRILYQKSLPDGNVQGFVEHHVYPSDHAVGKCLAVDRMLTDAPFLFDFIIEFLHVSRCQRRNLFATNEGLDLIFYVRSYLVCSSSHSRSLSRGMMVRP